MLHLGEFLPVAAFVFPIAVVAVAAGFDKAEEFAIADQIPAGLERRYFRIMAAVLVVPAVRLIRRRFAEIDRSSGDIDDIVVRRIAGDTTRRPW